MLPQKESVKIAVGLPNITGTLGITDNNSGFKNWTFTAAEKYCSGAFTTTAISAPGLNSVGQGTAKRIPKFDASFSNPIYGNSMTVQPPALTVNFFIRAK